MKTKNQMQPALKRFFEEYLPVVKGASDNTMRSYRYSFRLLFQFLYESYGIQPGKVDFSNLNSDRILAFLQWLEEERNCGISTRNQRFAAIRSFSNYASRYYFQPALTFTTAVSTIPPKKMPKKAMAYMTKEEMTILLSLPGNHTLSERRDRVLLSILYASGARAQELCDLRVDDVRFDKGRAYLTLHGKGKKARIVVIPEDCSALLKQFMERNKLSVVIRPDKHVFSSQTHELMTVSCVEGIYKKYVTIAKKKHPDLFLQDSYPPHSMRHSTACHLLEAGVDIVTIRNILGHVSVQTTQIYAEMSQDSVDKKLKEWNDAWFGSKIEMKESKKDIPDFLKKK